MKFSHLLNAKFYSKYRIDILFIIQTCLKSQKICCVGLVSRKCMEAIKVPEGCQSTEFDVP